MRFAVLFKRAPTAGWLGRLVTIFVATLSSAFFTASQTWLYAPPLAQYFPDYEWVVVVVLALIGLSLTLALFPDVRKLLPRVLKTASAVKKVVYEGKLEP